jgi:mono/diheme cytochrome c family protein
MKTLVLASTLLLAAGLAQANPYAGADIQAGKKTTEQKCNACHMKSAGGDGSGIYTRKESQIKSANLLSQQMEMCDAMGHGKLSDSERKNVLGWLNSQYYHFK